MTFTVAIVGRPNVGKSTLFNRLAGRRLALVHDRPGVTRDRRAAEARLGDLRFRVLDTAGLDPRGESPARAAAFERRVREQTERAVAEADLVLFVLDAREGLVPEDETIARLLRRANAAVVMVANKCEGRASDAGYYEAFALGLGEPVAISAEHGQGMGDLRDAIQPHLERHGARAKAGASDPSTGDVPRRIEIAIVGRPNVGKSTLANRLVGEERFVTGEEPGVTRDAIDADFDYVGRPLRLVDTAGLRRAARVVDGVEAMAAEDTRRAIGRCQLAIVVLDATEPVNKQDLSVAALAAEEGRALVLAANKWDLVVDRDATRRALLDRIEISLPQVKGVALVPVSAASGEGVDRLMETAFAAHGRWLTELGTAELNRWLERAIEGHSPPLVSGRRLKFRYATQVGKRPPAFALFTNMADKVPESYLRYLANDLRVSFGLEGVPIRWQLRQTRNPYARKARRA